MLEMSINFLERFFIVRYQEMMTNINNVKKKKRKDKIKEKRKKGFKGNDESIHNTLNRTLSMHCRGIWITEFQHSSNNTYVA